MRRWRRQVAVAVCVVLAWAAPALSTDPTMNSTDYQVHESEIGGNGQFDANSANYSLDPGTTDGGATLGEAAVGTGSSANYQAGAGFNTTAQPGLTVCVGATGTSCADMTGSSVSLGDLSTTLASTASSKFSVKNYTSHGYVVTIIGNAPSNSGDALTNLPTQTASSAGTEQFGINLRANSSPVAVGLDPVPVPSSDFSLSDPAVVVDSNYRTANQYRYNSGDQVAQAPQSSGETLYTISYLANISTTTPGGQYSGGMSIVVTGTY